jgi:hypothetical protein
MRQQFPQVRDDDRVVVDVGDRGCRVGLLRCLVCVRGGRQPRAKVNELSDAPLSRQPGDGPFHEAPAFRDGLRDARVDRQQFLRDRPVGGEVVFAAEEIIVDPSDRRSPGVKSGHGRHHKTRSVSWI